MDIHMFRVSIGVESTGTRNGDYTGKLVKSLLIDGDHRLKRFFKKESGSVPKLIHVTPLYTEASKVRCIHSVRELSAVGKYTFYVGFAETESEHSPRYDDVYTALVNIGGRHRFKDAILEVELLSVETIEIETIARSTVSSLKSSGKLKVVFASPTLLRDPFRAGKYKSLTPSPMNIFSTPVYINLHLSGRLNQRVYVKTLVALHRLLNEPYSTHKTTKVIKVKYDDNKKPIPALIGYVNLYMNRDYYEKYTQKGLDVDELLKETLATTIALGTGTSRATGFGHVIIQTPSGSSTGAMSFPETKPAGLKTPS